ncbi:NUDIX hydrolase [Gloeomargarita lithophora Alchichica-D10]|uniref:NUDIX hydrolase n=1 Tax=Gloeomargarita lithophora Alchichica-D10 TaxID=1188229 RepID=A0A1J0AGB1_9CYAN|nr:NUDIX hydrolase [Gloeomargarita lithophora]APB34951.1 NUDIX hydrolase [Gloeomargarita lithophora Alchichica-D10]
MTALQITVDVVTVIFSVDPEANRLLVLVCGGELPRLPGLVLAEELSLAEQAYQVLATKVQVEHLYLEQLYTFGGPGRDERETSQRRCLCVAYFALVQYQETVLLLEPQPVQWVPVPQLPVLWGDHAQIVQYGYQRLRNKLEYSPIAFQVLPELFTLGELYQLYTIILGEDFSDYSNFRSRLLKLGFLRDTGQKVCRGAGRPASLYRFDQHAFLPYQDKPMVFI